MLLPSNSLQIGHARALEKLHPVPSRMKSGTHVFARALISGMTRYASRRNLRTGKDERNCRQAKQLANGKFESREVFEFVNLSLSKALLINSRRVAFRQASTSVKAKDGSLSVVMPQK